MIDQPRGSGFSTLALHAGAGHRPTSRVGAIDPTASPAFDDVGDIPPADLPALDAPHDSTSILEERIATLEGGSAALAVASGQTATMLAFNILLQPGDEFVAARGLPGRQARQFARAFARFGWQVRWADPRRPESFVEALSDRTKAVFIESIAGSGAITDIEAIANVARRARVPLVVDNTLATPYLVRPFEHGADVVLHAGASVLGAAGSAVGIVVDGGSFDWLQDARYPSLSAPRPGDDGAVIGERFGNFAFAMACRMIGLPDLGSRLPDADAALILRGIETLSLRMQRHCDNAHAVARHLSAHPAVEWVRYAGLETDPDHELARRYCPRGAGSVLAFGLAGGAEAADAFLGRLKLFSAAAACGDTCSRIVEAAPAHPSKKAGSNDIVEAPDVIWASIGLEDAADITADLDQALRS